MHERKYLPSVVALVVGVGLVGVVACNLNPQPLPPDDDDRVSASPTSPSGGGPADGAPARPIDAGAFFDGSPPPTPRDSGTDGATDGSVEAGDAATDASDAGDGD